jgi:hypothetical protein
MKRLSKGMRIILRAALSFIYPFIREKCRQDYHHGGDGNDCHDLRWFDNGRFHPSVQGDDLPAPAEADASELEGAVLAHAREET